MLHRMSATGLSTAALFVLLLAGPATAVQAKDNPAAADDARVQIILREGRATEHAPLPLEAGATPPGGAASARDAAPGAENEEDRPWYDAFRPGRDQAQDGQETGGRWWWPFD